MKPAPFTYARPDTVNEVLELLAQNGSDARILAGGQSLVAMLNLRLVRPKVIVDIGRLTDLQYIKVKDGALEVGAGVTQAMLEAWPLLMESAPFVADVLPWVGHFQTRNRGTVCGSIAHNDPSSELPLALALLNGEVILKSKSGERRLKASAFQTGLSADGKERQRVTRGGSISEGVAWYRNRFSGSCAPSRRFCNCFGRGNCAWRRPSQARRRWHRGLPACRNTEGWR